MKKQNPKIEYDRENQILSLKVGGGRSVDSDIRGNVVIDYDKKGLAVGVNVYNFSFDAFRENRRSIEKFAKSRRTPLLVR